MVLYFNGKVQEFETLNEEVFELHQFDGCLPMLKFYCIKDYMH